MDESDTFLMILDEGQEKATRKAILAVGEGASHEVQEQLRSLGPDRILLRSMAPKGAAGDSDFRLDYGLKNVDLERIGQLVPELRSIAPWSREAVARWHT